MQSTTCHVQPVIKTARGTNNRRIIVYDMRDVSDMHLSATKTYSASTADSILTHTITTWHTPSFALVQVYNIVHAACAICTVYTVRV